MASVYGSKVKEPKLTRRSELPFEKQTPYAAGLAEAWASFGEAKSVLQRLEQTSGSPPVKDRTQRRPKPYHHVHFDPARATGAERTAHYGHTKTYSSTLSSGDGVAKKSKGGGGKENNEYLVEPKPLNEVESQQSMEQCEAHGAHMSRMGPLMSDSSMVYNPGRTLSNSQAGLAGSSSGEGHPLPPSTSTAFSQRYDSTVRFSVPSTTSVITFSSPSSPSSTLHPSPPSHPHTITTTTTTSAYPLSAATAASPSNPNNIGGSPHPRLVGGSSASPYSNATAVFGPPVKFGDSSGRHVPVSTTRHPTVVRPAEAPKLYSHSRSHATSASNSVHPRTSTQVAGVGGARSSVPIRTFELPTETLGTLRAKIELQKQAMRATSAKANNLLSSRNPTTSSATGFYPLPDGSTTATCTSSFASSSTSVGGARPRVPHPPTTARPPDASERAAKRRKIASAPPPRTYTGFSTSTSGRAGTKGDSSGGPTTVSWKSNLESTGIMGGAGGVALPSSLGAGAGAGGSGGGSGFRFSSQPTTSDTLEPPTKHRHLHTHSTASKTVRKVHKIPATSEAAPPPPLSKPKSAWSASASSKPPSGASGLITTSSWRAGKELRERILKGEEDKEVDRGHGRMDYRSTSGGGSRKREDTSPAHYSSASESQSNLSSSQENISAVSSSIDVHIQPERNLSESPRQAKTKDEVGRSHGARGALDVAEMLKDLEGSESPVPPLSPLGAGGGGGGRERERTRLGQARSTTSASGGPTSKKPRYNYEPSYPSERVRHYDQAEVQSYMLKKQEDRRRRELEEKQAREKMVREREEKLKQLYESQRKRVEANLRVKQKQRLAYSKALATGDIHIHLHTGSTTSSTSTLGSVADSAAPPVPTLAVHPPTPVSKSPTTIGSLTLHVHADADAASGGLPKSVATTSMLSPRYQSSPLRPSPPSHSPTPPHTSPPRYSRLAGVSPLSSREASRSPSASPRTYSVPSSASTSPKAHRSPTVSSQQHVQLHHSPPTRPTEHAQYSPGQPSLVRDAGHTSAAISASQSREERIRALTESALRLKERIAMESKRVEEGTFGVGPFHTVQQHPSPARPPFSNDQGYTPSVHLPGVRNVHEHALRAEKLRQEAEAATKIQAAYRGHRVRKSLRWRLPSGQTLGASLREGHTHRIDESRSTSSTDTLTPPLAKEDVIEKEISTPVISPLRGHTQKQEGTHVHAHVHTRPPTFEASGPQITSSSATAVPRLSPWQQTGGDEHSIINVFTRQHERLRQTLDQLSDQKRAEIRRFGDEGAQSETPKHSGSSLPASTQQPGATSVTHSHSYTYTFEQTSPSRSGSERSPHSSVFSEDSLHASPPPKHKPSSNKTSPSPSSSPRSHLSSPRSALSPPSRTNSASTLTGGSSSSNKSEPKSKQEERVVHAITPPGSPSFVDSFASLSPRSVSSQTSEPKSLPKSSSPPKPQLGATVKPPTGSIPPPGVQVSSTAAIPSVTVTESGGGRLSPRSLELKLHSELNLLETVEDSMRQLSQVESARAVSLAQQETVALAQLLKSRQQGHEQELQAVASKSEKEVEETRGKLDREAALMAEQRQRIEREHAEEMQRIREEASRVSHEATLRLNEARTAASDAVIQAAKEHLEAAHKITESAASAAAREAVKATLVVSGTQQQGPPPPHYHHKETATTSGSVTPNYESDFEADSLAGSETGKISETQSKLKSPATTSTRSQASGSSNTTIEEDIEQEGSDMEEEEGERESATPVLGSREPDEEAMEVRAGDETLVGGGGSELEESYQSQSPIEEMEEDISEASFQLLPSESHRRQHQRQQQAKLSLSLGRGHGRRGRSEDSEGSSYSRGSSPSQGEGSRVPSPMPSELSPSPGAGEDSFFQFMNRMVRAYMHEEELRARHQATLLRLREDALQEKTQAHLEWLKIKKKALQRKGDDDKMPPLARMEKGLLKKYKQEQAEIHRLKEAQKAARRERRVMLQQQKEISQMRRSAQYYRNKIHQHSRRVSHSPSPSPSLLLDEIKTTSSRLLDESELSMGDISVAEELSESESQRNIKSLTEPLEEDLEQSLPREYTEDFASYTASPEPVLTATISTETGSGQLEEEVREEGDRTLTAEDVQSQHQQTPVRPSKPKIKVSPPDDKKPPLGGGRKVTRTPKSPSSESHTVKELERMAAIDPHEYLSQREQRLMKRRRAAEEVLKQQQELLKKERILDKEEEKVNKLVTEALACYQQRTKIKKGRSKDKERSRHSSNEEIATSAKPRSPSTSPRLTKSPLEGERELGVNTKSSISEEIGASGSITAEVSEQILSQMSSSQPSSASAAALQTVHTLTSRGPSDYAMDTFESFQSSVSHRHQDHPPPPPHPLPLVTSTPSSSIQGSLKKEPLLSDISITESVTSMTSDGSGLEERIKLLKLQLQQKKEEMKRFQTEQKRKKKEVLRQQEEQLKRKLEIVENRAKQMKSAAAAPSIPLHSPGTATPTSSGSATPSQAYSEKSDNEMSRESTASPQPLPTPVADLSHPPHPSLSVEREAPVIMKDEERSVSPASIQEQLSPAAQSNSYTPFSDSITTGVHVTPTATSGDNKVDGLAHVRDDTVIKIDVDERRVGKMLSPTSIPEEHDTSHSTLIEEEEEEEGREIGEGEGEDRQQERPTVEVEGREKEVPGREVEPVAEELSVKSGSISEHISDLSSEGELLVDVEQVTVTQLSSNVKPRAEEGSPPPLGDEQYSESFEEPSSSTPASSPSSQAPPIGKLTPPPEPHEDTAVPASQVPPLDESMTLPIEPQAPPIEPQDEAAMATPVDEKPEDTTDIAEHEQVDSPNLIDTKEFEEEIGYQVGQRVLVGNVMAGTVRYIGHTHFAEGLWVGVEIDLPRGRNDGSIDDQRYFSCKPNYGLFAPPQKITIMEESPEYYDEEGEGEGERQQPPFEDDASSIAEEIEEEEQLPSEHELEEGNLEDRTQPETLDENAALEPPATIAHEGTPPPVDDDMYSPDFESSPEESEEGGAEADDEEERESEAKPEDGEGFEQVQVNDEPTAIEERRQEIEDYQWPQSEEGTRENSPMVELNHRTGKEETPPPVISQLLQKHQAEENREKLSTRTQPPSETDREVETITEGKKLGEKTSQITEHPPPASESLETLGKKSESFPQAPEVANQRSQSATPTPAPPPEFAEGALKEMPLEPPREIQTSGGETAASTLKQASEVISEELAQELTNEAYETMHNIWKVKREAQLATKGQATEYEPTDVVKMPLDKEAKLSLEDKADRVTDQLLALLLQSETNVACSIHNFKKSQEEEEEHVPLRIHIPEKTEEEAPSPTSPRTLLPRSPISREPERPVLSPVPEEPQDDEEGQTEAKLKEKGEEQEQEVTTPPVSPLRRGAPAKLILTGTATSSIIESSPPPLSPPSPYRNFVPSFIPAADEFSPPGSPPKHLSQASAARVAAGEKTPFLSSQDKERKGLERSTSTESITSLLDSLTIKTAQCMVPSERANVDQVVERSWQICEEIGFENLHHHSPRCPSDILDMFSDLHELSPEENHCRKAYLKLVFNLTVETLQNLHNVNNASPIWMQESAVRSLLVPEHKNSGGITLEKVQKRVYKALMRGQLPSQLPAVKFLRGMKRPGGREIDFVDTILIKELREEEPGWIDYCSDEASVKMKTADAILDSLITEAVQIMCDIGKKRQTRINDAHS